MYVPMEEIFSSFGPVDEGKREGSYATFHERHVLYVIVCLKKIKVKIRKENKIR